MSRAVAIVASFVLAVVGLTKLAGGVPIGGSPLAWLYFCAGVFEVALATMVVTPRLRSMGFVAGFVFFAGLSIGTMVALALFRSSACGCMGKVALTRGQALIVQGFMTALLAVGAWAREREDQGTPAVHGPS